MFYDPGQAPPGDILAVRYDVPVAVIGDIHGRADLLGRLLAQLPPDMPLVVAGDLCDRGPATREVLDLLGARGAVGARGNHDEWLTTWANGGGFDFMALSPMMKGEPTLASYGVVGRSVAEIEAQHGRVPEAHRRWLSALATAVDLEVMGTRWWVIHAGVPSTVDLAGLTVAEVVPHLVRTSPASLSWARNDPEEMLPIDRPVIMGHMPRRAALDTGAVLAIDTGAGTLAGGALTAVVLPERRFVRAG
jgi:serine/threonine protein phosphatase 1